ncbi:16S rRNA (uracil(1498)-N(3))-methyltransferase [Altibacter sp. HG106]|uniref:16S rRNA (uracil(1498)-N(3))-methyltransferase n=1 Tax=Altibacter sp. HG106 TaxID=3023937 RepID=UPI002350D14F|nr:16S rRNA (uracil(1498)-N(3))-methyltransferase [Altibacter sp. HG106]MDC7993483.1 16S rRNA (uracil(1498)-N(3))-methyltransferase [Altibacter sp. HG106]
MQLFYQPDITSSDAEVHFGKEESRHLHKVLRKREGDVITITNGNGLIIEAELTHVTPKSCSGAILKVNEHPPLPYALHMAVAPTKLNDRFEWFLEKATEIGVTEITPIYCDHSERKTIKPERYEKIVQSAMKQSLRAYLPTLNKAQSFLEFIHKQHDARAALFLAHCEEGNKKQLKDVVSSGASVVIAIGPEGDFSSEEIKTAHDASFQFIDLGNYRLRTETAAIVACHTIALINQ